MRRTSLEDLDRLLVREETFIDQVKNTRAAKQLSEERGELLAYILDVSRGDNLSMIIAMEKMIVEGDMARYANSNAMSSSLTTAIEELHAVERHIALVNDKAKYKLIDQGHSLPKKRRAGLPFDDARQALSSHYTRLINLDKSRLDEDEKQLINARKSAMIAAEKLYIQCQTNTLDVAPPPKSRRKTQR